MKQVMTVFVQKALFILVVGWKFSEAEKEIVIGGIFPMTGGWAGGQACYPAAKMAIDDVNNRSDILPGHKLKLIFKDSKCDTGLGIKKFYELWTDKKIFTLMTGCSSVSTPIAESAYLWNINVIAFGASSPALSNRNRFKTFFRTHPSASLHNPTRIKLFKKFGWSRIAIINQDTEVFSSTANDLMEMLNQENMTVSIHQSFHADPKVPVQNLKKADARIIVGLFYEGLARKVMCNAYKEKLYGSKYVWFLIGWYKNDWYKNLEKDISCTEAEMLEVVQGHFTTEILMLDTTNQVTVSNMRSSEFILRLNKLLPNKPEKTGGYGEAGVAYDAVWAIALALNSTILRMEKSELTRDNQEIGNKMYHSLNRSKFKGISGPVVFDSDGSRMAWTKTEQFENNSYKKIMEYDYRNNKTVWSYIPWKNYPPPKDRTITKIEPYKLSRELFIAFSILTSCCIGFCLACLIFNIRKRERSFIVGKASDLNSLSLVGNIILLVSILLFGPDINVLVCEARAGVLMIGFSLAYSPLFAKLWTVNALHKKALIEEKEKLKSSENNADHIKHNCTVKVAIDSGTVAVMAIALTIDVILLISWSLIDRLKPEKLLLQENKKEDEDGFIVPELHKCVSEHFMVWVGVSFVCKTIQLLLGAFLAYESRSKIHSNTDHKTVAIAVYNITTVGLFCAPIPLLLRNDPNLFFVFLAIPIIISTMASTAIIFVPKIDNKINELRRRHKNNVQVGSTSDVTGETSLMTLEKS